MYFRKLLANSSLIVLFLLNPNGSKAQQSRIIGIVSIHNSQTFLGQRKYVNGADVNDDFNQATPQRTDYLGNFSLIFFGVSNGSSVSFQVKKKNLQVVNIASLKAVAGQIDTIRISMAHSDSIAEFRRKYYNISKNKAELYANRLIKEKEKRIIELTKNNLENLDEINKILREKEDLINKKSNIENQAMELADKYAPINFDDATPVFRNSFVLFQQGNIDSALLLIKTVDVERSIKDFKVEEEKIKRIQEEASRRISKLQSKKLETGDVIKFTADLYKTKFEFDNALKCYEQLLQLDSNDYNYNFEYAKLLVQLNYNEKAIDCYKRAVKACESISDTILQKTITAKAEAAIGSNFKAMGKVDSAYIHDSIALYIFFRLRFSENEFAYPHETAGIINDLSTIYWERSDFATAEAGYLRAYSIIEPITKEGNIKEEIELAGISNNLGSFYKSIEDTSKAKLYYAKALDIYRKNKSNPELVNRDLVNTLNNLSGFYMENDSVKAEQYLTEALQICSEVSKKDKRLFVVERSLVNVNLGRLYHIGNNFRKAELHYMQSFDAIEPLYKSNHVIFQLEVADISMRLGMLYKNFSLDSVSIVWLSASLDLYNKHCTKEKCIYEEQRGLILSLLGGLFFKKNEILRSIYYHHKSYESYDKLYKLSSERYANKREEELQHIMYMSRIVTVINGLFKIFTGITLSQSSIMIQERHIE